MRVDTFNRRSVVQRNARKVTWADDRIDPGFEDIGHDGQCRIAPGLVANFGTTFGVEDGIVDAAVLRGEYFQMPTFEARAEP